MNYKQVLHQIVITFFLQNQFYKKIILEIRISCYEKKMGNFTAGMFKNYKHSVEELVNKDQGFYFMNQIRGTPAIEKGFSMEFLQ